MTEKRLTDILTQSGSELASLVNTARGVEDLSAVILAALPGEYRGHVGESRLNGTTLNVTADSPAWAARLRYASPELIVALTEAGHHVEDLHVRVVIAS